MYPLDQSNFVGFGPQMRFKDVARSAPRVTTAATDYPVDLAAVKLHCRITNNDEDTIIQDFISAAVEEVEHDAEIALMTQTRTLYMDFFPAWEIELRQPPIQSVVSVKYLDFNNVQQTLDPTKYRVDIQGRPGIITPAFGTFWPVAYAVVNAVEVAFVCGSLVSNAVPPSARLAIYLKVSSRYWNREMMAEDDQSYQNLVDKLRWRKIA